MGNGTIYINKISLENTDGRTRLIFDITENGQPKQTFFDVEEKYGEFLCHERCDAIVIGLLSYAMRKGYDMESNIPITEELLYNLNEYLIPALTKYDAKLTAIKIDAPTAESLSNAGAVGTGMSCGVDSFYSALSHIDTPYKSRNLTHLVINNVGAFLVPRKANIEVRTERENTRKDCYDRARRVANELNLPLIETNSNFQFEFHQDHLLTHTYSSMFAVYCLQKLWKTYYYSSAYELNNFSLENNSDEDAAFYEIFSLNCFSTDKLRIYSGGATCSRFEKVKRIADNKIAQENLQVCIKESPNCNWCVKCRRTIMELYALGKLEKFGKVFDLDYFKKNKTKYLGWLYIAHLSGDDEMSEPTYYALKHEIKLRHKIAFGFVAKIIQIGAIHKIITKIFGDNVRAKLKDSRNQ